MERFGENSRKSGERGPARDKLPLPLLCSSPTLSVRVQP